MATKAQVEFLKKKVAGEKSYVVTEVSYRYNDEIYSQEEGGTPKIVHTDLEKAKQDVLERTHKLFIEDFDLHHYFYEVDDILKRGKTVEDLKNIGVVGEDKYEMTIPKGFTLEQTKKLLNIITLEFFEIHEVDVAI